ncbi:A24 family peptidase [Ammonicoccus fulvus]|uniref:A24 family peptidase n=1 Tax=Ammonicoccus fulvus TaxID=3138240 RepID=A0ABZ3FTE7_9ACTN
MWIALVLTGVMTGIATGPVLHLLPEPATTEPKRPYRELATVGFAALVTACSMLALGVVAARLPAEAWPIWIALATVGVLLAAIDAMTTYLPYRLTVALWAFGLVGTGVSVALSDEPASLLMRIALGAIGAWVFFWLFWRLSRGSIGFGDVRLAPVLGGVTASVSGDLVLTGLLIGTLVGAAHGLLLRARGKGGPFPYGPALVIGSFVALALLG